jgi:putative oxygen-independent coproporphyrinogen III oxidase
MVRGIEIGGSRGAGAAPRFASLPPLALYIHIPWCVRKCPYCDFNSHEAREGVPQRAYLEALAADLDQALPLVWGRRIYSIFFGGGTPSLFDAESIDALLSAVRARLPLAAGAEITLEANPGAADAGKFAGYRAAGVNRLSIGVQSFDRRHLHALGRIHDERQAHAAVERARTHFDNFNIDLMYALPGQSPQDVHADLVQALAHEPPHLSVYHLTIEPNTWFHGHPPAVPDDDTAAAMQETVEAALAQGGYDHYETSAYARPGHRCRHNMNYWTYGDYLGIGAGAHSKLSFPERIVRQARYRQPAQYMARALEGAAVQTEQCVDVAEITFEFTMNALRLTEGYALGLFEERTGVPLTAILPALERAERAGLIERDHSRVAPTELGRRFLNDLLQLFLPEEPARSGAARTPAKA